MKQQAFEKATQYIEAMAAKLGVAAEHVYGLMVRQQFAEGIMETTLGVIALTLFAVLVILLAGAYLKPEYREDSQGFYRNVKPANSHAKLYKMINDSEGLFFIPYTIVQVLLLVVGVAFLYEGILAIINPEYYAIKEILDTLAGGN